MLGFISAKIGCCKILVVGCNHGIQYREHPLDSREQRDQKIRFVALLDRVIKDNRIQFVGEEWGREVATAAYALAEATDQITWANINTSCTELAQLGIPEDYTVRNYPDELKERWNRQREQVMIRKLLENRGTAKRLVVVCGFGHMQALTESLRQTCRCAKPVDYRRLDWYDENAFPL